MIEGKEGVGSRKQNGESKGKEGLMNQKKKAQMKQEKED